MGRGSQAPRRLQHTKTGIFVWTSKVKDAGVYGMSGRQRRACWQHRQRGLVIELRARFETPTIEVHRHATEASSGQISSATHQRPSSTCCRHLSGADFHVFAHSIVIRVATRKSPLRFDCAATAALLAIAPRRQLSLACFLAPYAACSASARAPGWQPQSGVPARGHQMLVDAIASLVNPEASRPSSNLDAPVT